MRDLKTYYRICRNELLDIGIHPGYIAKLVVNTRAKNRWGLCKMLPNGTYQISISSALLDERCDVSGLKNTILHELLHTCPGCMSHGPEWKRLANKVNAAYGYNIKRCNDSEEKGVSKDMEAEKANTAKYLLACPKCGRLYPRYRMSQLIQHPEEGMCSNCLSPLIRKR